MIERKAFVSGLAALLLAAASAEAAVKPPSSALQDKAFRDPDLGFQSPHLPLSALRLSNTAALEQELATLGVAADHGFYDVRAGRWGSLILREPLIPGTGKGNNLRWQDLGLGTDASEAQIKQQAWPALRSYLQRAEGQLHVDLSEVGEVRTEVHDGGALIHVYVGRSVGGVPVRDSYLSATINHGNLILLGLVNWGAVDAGLSASISADDARAVASSFVQPFEFRAAKGKPQLELVPAVRNGGATETDAYSYRLVWNVSGSVSGSLGNWEALVDANSGKLLLFGDRNQYDKTKRALVGGVFPVSNDGQPPDGVEQKGYPMPYADLGLKDGGVVTYTTTSGISRCVDSTRNPRTTLSGRFVSVNDTCGAIAEGSEAKTIRLGGGPGTDCTVPPNADSLGDTHASRTSFYEVNRKIEQAKGYLPDNAWVASTLPVNVNILDTCNAFWNGSSINFFRDSGSPCRNTGEIAGVFDHEWGHGLDNNGVNPNIAPPGEGIADINAMVRLQTSCLGRGFFKNGNCSGYGDACLDCSGIRDVDYAKHQSGQPADLDWILSHCGGGSGPCGREVHCEGYPMGEAAWDLATRTFPAPPFNYDSTTAWELTTRLYTIGMGPVGSWYQCTPPFGGCQATGGYMELLGVDDDNGDLTDGTPHMTAIYDAFNAHQLACSVPAPKNGGCEGGPVAAPNVIPEPLDQGAMVTVSAVPGGTSYALYRTEGVHGCDFGKAKVGELVFQGGNAPDSHVIFEDQGLKNGSTYWYTALPIGQNPSCYGPAAACKSVVPKAGSNMVALENPKVEILPGGDNDIFLDNCETARVTVSVENTGAVPLTNVRIVSVTPLTHPDTVILTPLPAPIVSSLAPCDRASGTFDFEPHGMNFDETTRLQVVVTADELSGGELDRSRSTTVSVANVESDFESHALIKWGFDADLEGWIVTSGTFVRQPGGANGSPFYLASSQCLDAQCDTIRSPLIRLQETSRLSLFQRYDTETPVPIPYDRANVGVIDATTGDRTAVIPDGGKLYDLPPNSPNGACVTATQAGWSKDTDPDCNAGTTPFLESTWSSGALNPGGAFRNRNVYLSVAFGTDPAANGWGFHFDEPTLTDFQLQVKDAQQCDAVAQRTNQSNAKAARK